MTKQEYLSNWHRLFVENVNAAQGFIVGRIIAGNLSKESMEKLAVAKAFLEGNDINDVERDLSRGVYTEDTLNKTERIYVKIAEFIIDVTIQGKQTKQIMKDFAHRFEHYQKEFTHLQLEALK